MAFKKFASFEVSDILGIKGASSRRTASLDKFADFDDYRTEDGFLYARIRAISSRVNKNHDGWPSVELAGSKDVFDRHLASGGGFTVEASKDAEYGFSTFLGKPIFVDHNNSDPERARGVIVDAKLHVEDHKTAAELDPYYASAPSEHLPPTWVELLLEVDAKSFPKFAKAILDGSKDARKGIDGFSMGCDVDRSVCSICRHSAVSPDEFCQHVKLKGAYFDYIDDDGHKTSKRAYEDCYGIKFFEISGVFDPADETALTREVRSAYGEPLMDPLNNPEDHDLIEQAAYDGPSCPQCGGRGRHHDEMDPRGFSDCPACEGTGAQHGNDGYMTPERIGPQDVDVASLRPEMLGPPRIGSDNVAHPCPDCESHTTELLNEDGESHCHGCGKLFKSQGLTPKNVERDLATAHRTADNPLPQSDMLHAPEDIDTLRKEMVCPICGSTMDSEACEVCGYIEPPENFKNPDLEKAQEADLHQDQQGPNGDDVQVGDPSLSPVQPENPQVTSHVKEDMATWKLNVHPKVAGRINTNEQPIKSGEVSDEPDESVVSDQTAPVTSRVRTASDFIKAAGRNKEKTMDKTAEAASGAPAVATPDTNTDVVGVGGIVDATNEEASKADGQVDVLGEGGTGVEGVAADSTSGLDQGDEHSKNIEAIPTKTFDDGSSAVERQEDPVGGDVFPAADEGVKAAGHFATDAEPFPKDDGGLSGGGANQGTQPVDPVGKAEDRVDVLDSVTSPENNSGPTKTWTGTDGNSVTRQQDPVTNDTLEGEDLVNLSPKGSAHIFAAFKLADLEVELGLLESNRKYARVAELEQLSPASIQAQLAYAQKVKTAGLSKGVVKSAKRLPQLGRNSSTEKSAETQEEFGDELLFS